MIETIIKLLAEVYAGAGSKIPAIKKIRDYTGAGLKESKDLAELILSRIEREMTFLGDDYREELENLKTKYELTLQEQKDELNACVRRQAETILELEYYLDRYHPSWREDLRLGI